MEKKDLKKAVGAVAVTKQTQSVHVIKEHHARNRMEMEQWIKRKNKLRAKAIVRGINPSDFMLNNDIVRSPKAPFPQKRKTTKRKGIKK